ncbi:T9SS type A sorting domain-containing protein [Flavobacterium pallidum]|uniref:Uncharacterized protein n=1 Tax=Flavobacterium pallidum TaxID=2172098 RepID=A0A2S1SDN9_9FLAO|nr:T9SS type A sorting domain-containing protein [Flavobacterium pallidum]AWI24482.1 hypothetical protein HYN49_00460 [Flavobacterium pallidum]
MKKIYLLLLLTAGIAQAQIVDIPDPGFKNYLLTANCIDSNNDGTYDTDADLDNDGEVQATEAASAFLLTVTGAGILDLQGIEAFVNIKSLSIANTAVTQISLSGLQHLETLWGITSNPQLASLQISNMPVMTNVHINSNAVLPLISINACPAATSLECLDNPQLTDVDFTGSPALGTLDIENNHFTTLNLSKIANITSLLVKDAFLEILILKNGHTESPANFVSMTATDNPNLRYICADPNEIPAFQAAIDFIQNNSSMPHFAIYPYAGNYCTFTPGGNYNTITGKLTNDLDANGCDDSDPEFPLAKMKLTQGSNQYAAFTNSDSVYKFFTAGGNFTVAPNFENPSFFNVSPATAAVSFPGANNLTSVKDFCISPNGVHPEVEVVVAPINAARPGFDAKYIIAFKNNGNQTLSGTIDLMFEDSVLNFLNAAPAPDAQGADHLFFNYANLLPFENRYIEVTMHLNAPTDTPAVNDGDHLDFSVNITPAADDIPANNTFSYTQTVVNSLDPNEIECLEGDLVAPTEVGKYLHYIINFENIGSASAVNVVVRQIFDAAKFDLSSLQILNSSAPLDARLSNNILELIFKNIELGTGGHGNILLKIRTNPTLPQGTTVTGQAGIFFDYNFPVNTDIVQTLFDVLSSGDTIKDDSLNIYPNPTSGMIYVDAISNISSVEFFDAHGRLLLVKKNSGNKAGIDMSGYAAGVYYARVTTAQGIKTEKVIKK